LSARSITPHSARGGNAAGELLKFAIADMSHSFNVNAAAAKRHEPAARRPIAAMSCRPDTVAPTAEDESRFCANAVAGASFK
jgi:hypothetical protein